MNLFIAVIFMNFTKAQHKSKNSILTPSQIKWIQLQKLIIELNPKYQQNRIPHGYFRKIAHYIVNHKFFELFIFIIVVASIVTMSIFHENASKNFLSTLNFLDQIFILIFLLEVILKLLTLGLRSYFYNKWNQFDFIITSFSVLDIGISSLFSQELLVFQIGPKILRSIRILRVGRLLRLIKNFDGILKILQTLMFSLPMTFNILALLLLVFFMYTIIGCSLFSDIPHDKYINDYVNFKNFLFGIMTLFKLCTGDEWSYTMLEIQKYNGKHKIKNKK